MVNKEHRPSAWDFITPLKSQAHGNFFKTSNEQIIVFIDQAKPDFRRDNRKYLFRVITKSHPWGYQRRENQKTLEAKHVRQALRAYGTEGYDLIHQKTAIDQSNRIKIRPRTGVSTKLKIFLSD